MKLEGRFIVAYNTHALFDDLDLEFENVCKTRWTCFSIGYCALKLANYFGDHMVLQRGPQQAVLWGTADTEGDTVTAIVTGQGSQNAHVTTTVTHGAWKVKLPAQTSKGPFVISVSSSDGHVTLHDVLFGDVWLCSGQSNMYFTFNHVSITWNKSSTSQLRL